jgi:hypothetical protein
MKDNRNEAIPKHIYDKASSWMADNEDNCLLEEQMPKEEVNQYLLDEAMDILGWVYETYNKERGYTK